MRFVLLVAPPRFPEKISLRYQSVSTEIKMISSLRWKPNPATDSFLKQALKQLLEPVCLLSLKVR